MTRTPKFTPTRQDLPSPDEMLAKLDARLKAEAQGNQAQVVKALRDPVPVRSGRTRASARGQMRSTRQGYTITAGFGTAGQSGERAHVVRFLEGGTGSLGGHGRIPKARRGFIRGTGVPSGRGQRPQKVWTRGLKGARRVNREIQGQMRNAWDALVRELGR